MQILRKLDEVDIKTSKTKIMSESEIRNKKTRENTTNNTQFNNEASLLTDINAKQQTTETVDEKKQSCKSTQTIKTEPIGELKKIQLYPI